MTDNFTPAEWAYLGRRLPSDGKTKPWHAWQDETGRELHYTDGAAVIGGIYEVEVLREEESVRARIKGAKYLGRKVDADEVARNEALDAGTRQELARQAAERKHARSSELDEALAPVLRIARSCRTRHEATMLASVVSSKITEAWWTR